MSSRLLQLAAAHDGLIGSGGGVVPTPPDSGGTGGTGGGGITSTINARSAYSFNDFPGVNTHFHYTSASDPYMYELAGPYSSPEAAVYASMAVLKFRHVRNEFSQTTRIRTIMAYLNANQNVKMLFIAGSLLSLPLPSAATIATEIKARYVGMIDGVSGINEPDLAGNSNWINLTKNQQAAVYSNINPLGIPVYSPPLGIAGDITRFNQLGPVANADVNDMHIYPGGNEPSTDIDRNVTRATGTTGTFPNKPPTSFPTVVTETGYQTGMLYHGGNPPCPEDIEGIYAPKLVAEYYLRGFRRAYFYQLFDGRRDTNTASTSNSVVREKHFGLFAWDSGATPTFRAKPVATALGNLMTITADTGGAFIPQPLKAALTATSDVRSVLLGKQNGSYLLLLWRNVSLFTPNSSTTASGQGTRITPSPQTQAATLTLNAAAPLTLYQPTISAAAQSTRTSNSSHALTVGTDLLIVKIG